MKQAEQVKQGILQHMEMYGGLLVVLLFAPQAPIKRVICQSSCPQGLVCEWEAL